VAVGGYTDSSGNQQGLLLATRGSSWTATKAPLPAGAATNPNADLPDVACPSASACVAVGSYTDSSGNQQGLLLATRGSSWTATKAPLPAGAAVNADANLPGHDLACPSTSSCVAAGSYLGASGYTQGLLLASRGSSWTATKAPLPAGAKAGWLASVACPSAAVCVAAGQYYDRSGNWQGLLLAGRGSSWTVIKAPLPAGAATSPSPWVPGVACPSAATCVAAGYYTDAAGYPQGMLLTGPG
jgi:hypothetical protein